MFAWANVCLGLVAASHPNPYMFTGLLDVESLLGDGEGERSLGQLRVMCPTSLQR